MVVDNPPAFPRQADFYEDGSRWEYPEYGMTLRDWFAGKAMPEIVAGGGYTSFEGMAEDAYALADAMLKVRGQ